MNINYALNQAAILSNIQRFSMIKLSAPESVLEHTGFVAITTMFITNYLKDNGEQINVEVALSKALVHDFDETVTGDLPRTLKYASTVLREEIYKIEKENMLQISKNIDGTTFFYILWSSAKDGNEGLIVEFVDFIAALYKMHNEIVLRGNITMKDNIFDGTRMMKRIGEFITVLTTRFKKSEDFFYKIEQDLTTKVNACLAS